VRVGFVYSGRYLEHNPGTWHPESPARLTAITGKLKDEGLWENVHEPEPAKMREILAVHDESYVRWLMEMCRNRIPVDSDTPTAENTFEIAALSAGGALLAGRLVESGEVDFAFALIRPPGHHAGRSSGGGFCYLNNIAIMTRDLLRRVGRVLIFDFDAHHGNGTQEIFYKDPEVLYISVHQSPLYPGTGKVEEIGEGEGRGFNINIPVPPGTGDEEYATIVDEILIPVAVQFEPEIIAVSAGFDAHARDPLTQLELSGGFYGWMAGKIFETAERICGGRVVFLLEGGYDLRGLSESVVNVVRAAKGKRFAEPARRRLGIVEKIRSALSWKWRI